MSAWGNGWFNSNTLTVGCSDLLFHLIRLIFRGFFFFYDSNRNVREIPFVQPSSFNFFSYGGEKVWFKNVRLLGFPFLAFSFLYWICSLSEFPLFKWKRQLVHFHSLFGYINSRNGIQTNEWTVLRSTEKRMFDWICVRILCILTFIVL